MEETEKKLLILKNKFKDLFCNNTELKDLVFEDQFEKYSNIIQHIGRQIPIHLKEQVAD